MFQNPHISNKNRHISWEKIKLLIHILKNNSDEFIVWMDDDIYITNMNIELLNIIKDYKFNNFLLSKDVIDFLDMLFPI